MKNKEIGGGGCPYRHIHNGILFRLRKKGILPFVTYRNLEDILLSEISYLQKEK